MTVTSELHAQAESTKKQKRKEKAASWGGSDKDRARDDGAQARGRAARGRERGDDRERDDGLFDDDVYYYIGDRLKLDRET